MPLNAWSSHIYTVGIKSMYKMRPGSENIHEGIHGSVHTAIQYVYLLEAKFKYFKTLPVVYEC